MEIGGHGQRGIKSTFPLKICSDSREAQPLAELADVAASPH